MVTVFESENIRFVKFTEELADDYLKMVNDIEHVARFIGERRTPYTMEEELEFIRNQKLMQPYTYSMIEKATGEFIGNTGFIQKLREGDDKPLKYPGVFQVSDAVIINKIDTMPVFDFDRDAFCAAVRDLNPKAPIFPIAATKGDGVEEWASWLAERVHSV